ncbi:MAG: DUF4097 family beta strand repeat-containing protein [Myxococcota bacterium]
MTRLLSLLPLAACVSVHEDDVLFVAEPFDIVYVGVDHGDIEVFADDAERPRVEVTTLAPLTNPASVHAEVRDGALHVSAMANCGDDPARGCAADLRLVVPRDVTVVADLGWGDLVATGTIGGVHAESGAGDMLVQSVRGDVELTTAEGDLTLLGVDGSFRADTGAGDIVGMGLVSPAAQAWTSAGDVALTFDGLDDLSAASGAGDVTLHVPAGGYALDLDAEAGDVTVDGVTRAYGGPSIAASTAAGDISVRGD